MIRQIPLKTGIRALLILLTLLTAFSWPTLLIMAAPTPPPPDEAPIIRADQKLRQKGQMPKNSKSTPSNSESESEKMALNGTANTRKAARLMTKRYKDSKSDRIINVRANEILVRFRKGITAKEKSALLSGQKAAFVTRKVDLLQKIGYGRVRIPEGAVIENFISMHEKDPTVEDIEPNALVYPFSTSLRDPDDPLYSEQWGLEALSVPEAWAITQGDPRVVIAFIDSGADMDHPDLTGNLMAGYNFVNDTELPEDDFGHGTQVIGIVAAKRNNGLGIAGVAPGCKILPLKTLDVNGEGSCADVAEAIIYAADSGCRIINLALGTYFESEILREAVNYASKKNCVIITAGGNNGSNEPCYPADYPGTISVAALDQNGFPCSFSNHAYYIDIAAPGKEIKTTAMKGEYTYMTGTSAASAYISGLAALIISQGKDLTNETVQAIVRGCAKDIGKQGWDDATGMGMPVCIDALTAPKTALVDIGIVDLFTLPVSPMPDQSVNVFISVRNHGGTPEKQIKLAVKNNDNIIFNTTIKEIASKEVHEIKVNWHTPKQPSEAVETIIAQLDALPGETLLQDNTKTIQSSISSEPIHDVAILDWSTLGTPFEPGSTVTLIAKVGNLGNQTEENISLDLLYQKKRPVAPTRFLSLAAGEIATFQFKWEVPSYTPGPNELLPLYFLRLSLGQVENEKDIDNNSLEIRFGFVRGQNGIIVPFHKVEEEDNQYVHQWIANEAYNYFTSQIENADVGNYLGTIPDSHGDSRNTFLEGTAAEDKGGRPPLYQSCLLVLDCPYMRHFCAGADGAEILEGLWGNDSALQQASNIWQYAIDSYQSNKALSFYYLGHVAHLIGDMTVPAHVHNDIHPVSDIYEDTIAYSENFKLWEYGGECSGEWSHVLTLFEDLNSIFYKTANYTEDYDSDDGDGDGDGPPYYDPDDYPDDWHHPEHVSNSGGIEISEVTIIGDDLMPYAMRRTAELFRFFYYEVDTSDPAGTMTYPASEDVNNPTYRNSTSSFHLAATATDSQSGIVKEGYQFRYSYNRGDGWSSWYDANPSPTASSVSFTPPFDNAYYCFHVYVENGGGIISGSTLTYLYVDTIAPTMPTVTGYSNSGHTSTLISGNGYLYSNPHFHFSASDSGSGIEGYYYYWGTNSEGNPSTWNTSGDYTGSELISGQTYYLRVKAKDKAGNISSISTFVYKYLATDSYTYDATCNKETSSPSDILTVSPGEEIAFSVVMTNVCNFDWSNYSSADHYVELRSVDKDGNPALSYVYPGTGWIDSSRVGAPTAAIVRGSPTHEDGWFIFKGKVPAHATLDSQETIYFKLYHKTHGYFGDPVSFTLNIQQAYTPPSADFILSTGNPCALSLVHFTDNSSHDPTVWDWDFGDNSQHNLEQNPNHIYNKAGTYTVILTVTNTCGSNTKSMAITVKDKPMALFRADSKQGTAPFTIHLKSESTGEITSLAWNFGDGNSLTLSTDFSQEVNYTYHTPGSYSLTLTATNDCGSDTAMTYVYVYTTPKGSLTGIVTDKDGVHLAEARIIIPSVGETATENDGTYSLSDIPEGEYRIIISKAGYQTLTSSGIKIAAAKESNFNAQLEAKDGSISGKVVKGSLDQDPNGPIEGAKVIALTMAGVSQSFEATTDAAGYFTMYLPSGTYKVTASANGYEPAMDSNQSFGYPIDPNTTLEGVFLKLEPKANGPRLQVNSLEWDADPNTNTVNNKTRIMIFVDSDTPLNAAPDVQFDPNIMGTNPVGSLSPNPAELKEETIVAGRVIEQHYETVYFDYRGTGIDKAGILVLASDAYGQSKISYAFEVDSNTIAGAQDRGNEGGTSEEIIPAEGGKTGTVGLIDTDNDGISDDYDESFIDVPPCALVGGSQGLADPNFDELSRLFIKVERKTPQGENIFTAQYDVQILDEKGNKATNVQINKNQPITVYLHFDPARFNGDLSNVIIKYLDPAIGQWKSDGIKNVRIVGNTIAFEIEHITLFGAFSSKPTMLAAIVSSGKINLSWQDNSDNETGFEIHRKVDNQGDFSLYQTVNTGIIAYVDSGCTEGKTYYYKVRAVTPFGPTEFSNEASGYVPIPPATVQKPAAPASLTITKKSEKPATEIELTWQDNSDNEDGFKIYRKADDEETFSLLGTTGANILSFTDQGLDQNKTYSYYIIAYNSAGDSAPSNIEGYTVPPKKTGGRGGGGGCFITAINTFQAKAGKWANKYFDKVQKTLYLLK